jgi:ComF family protein
MTVLVHPFHALRHSNLGHALQDWAAAGVDLLFPPRCVTCGRAGRLICARCAQLVTPTPETLCTRCGRVQPARVASCAQCADDPDFPLDHVRAAALHTAPLREWIHLLKYEGRRDLAPALARYLTATLAGDEWAAVRTRIDAVVPTPLHAERLRQRGYNQAELLARGLCQQTGLPLRTDLLRREKSTQSQVGLNAAARKANVEGAFAATPACRGLHLLLIDDVYTTGATLQACARALRAAGATHVAALTLALPNHHSSSMHHDLSHS